MKFQTTNPATEEVVNEFETMSKEQVVGIVDDCYTAYKQWRTLSIQERIPFVKNLANVFNQNKAKYAALMSKEMGKPLKAAEKEVEKCAWLCEVYADNAEQWIAPVKKEADGLSHEVVYQPLGVILAVMPWNFPFWQVARFMVPTLLVGNTAVLKHSNACPESALALEEACKEAGFPPNTFRTLLADHESIAAVMEHDAVQGVSLTGSTAAGKRIGELAGKNIKKVVLELGGSDPFIILEDADIEVVAKNAVLGRTMNTGQSCIAAKRFIVHESIAEAFGKRFAELASEVKVGDPNNDETVNGPLFGQAAVQEMEDFVKDAVDKGGKILTGGQKPEGKGYFFPPTVITNTTPDMKIVAEEVFGPIAPIITFQTEEQALEIANSTEFGLGGSVWTKDLERGKNIAAQIESGTVFVNSITKSDPRMPFGGVKQSGIGRELAEFGMHEFVNIKGISVYEHK